MHPSLNEYETLEKIRKCTRKLGKTNPNFEINIIGTFFNYNTITHRM